MTLYRDLPPDVRKQVDRAIGRRSSTKERTRARPSRAEVAGSNAGRCACGLAFPSYLLWEKHYDAEGKTPAHGRWNIDVTPSP